MQKSRRALVKRRAAAQEQERSVGAAAGRKRRLYGFSASLVVASWVALLLLNSLVGHGDGQRGMSNSPPSSLKFLKGSALMMNPAPVRWLSGTVIGR
jgi:hypothetical protein